MKHQRNGSLKKNPKKRGNSVEPSRDRNVKDNNKRTRTGNAFATTANPVRREYTGAAPKCANCPNINSWLALDQDSWFLVLKDGKSTQRVMGAELFRSRGLG
ncbi:hypothetical protein Tco_1541428 [Tanacetum coccineum]